MAKRVRDVGKETEVDEGPRLDETQKANTGARKDYLLSRKAEIDRIKKDIAMAMSVVKPLRKTLGNQFRLLKSELGFDRAYAEWMFKLVDMEDAEKQDAAVDQIRELFTALNPGEQGELFAQAEPEPPFDDHKPAKGKKAALSVV